MTRKLVYQTLEFDNPKRLPRDNWTLPWAKYNHPEYVKKIARDFPADMKTAPGFTKKGNIEKGHPFEIGQYTDAWGCTFENIQRGIIGEVRNPIITDDEFEDLSKVHIPTEWLDICARPFERLQFLRGTENVYMDLAVKSTEMLSFLKKIHEFYINAYEKWAKTDIDAIVMMDDWGAQNNLLISPELWVEIFKPMYKDYCDIAKANNKKIFMHSDGDILKIYPHLIEIGIDAINSQIFCMGLDNLNQYKGKITFWGEIDRQHTLVEGTKKDVRNAVTEMKDKLYDEGGIIALCEFGAGAKPENVYEMYKVWNEII